MSLHRSDVSPPATARCTGGSRFARVALWIPLLLVAVTPLAHAEPISIALIGQRHSTLVLSTWDTFDGTGGSERTTVDRTLSSAAPLSDQLVDLGIVEASAAAGLFELSTSTDSRRPTLDGEGNMTWGVRSVASATTDVTFSPLTDGLGTIGLDLTGYAEFYFSEGFASLTDVTTNQGLWHYGWDFFVFDGSMPWQGAQGQQGINGIATLELETAFDATHVYQLTTFISTNSNPPDRERIDMRVSGLHVVPEPATSLCLGLGLCGLWCAKRRIKSGAARRG